MSEIATFILPFSEWSDFLQKRGVAVEEALLADGANHRLATHDKPNHKNASYKITTLSDGTKTLYLKDFSDPSHDCILQTANLRSNSKAYKELEAQKVDLPLSLVKKFAGSMCL